MLMFNIPATKEICGRVCSGCYSHKAYKIYPNVLPAQKQRYSASLQLDFVDRICREIKATKKPVKYFRVHASAGEFYSQAYVDSWADIASKNPDITFYAYTKRMKTYDFSGLVALPNFVIIDSLFFKGLNYGKIDEAPKEAFLCPDQKGSDISCGVDCTWCMTKGCADEKGVWFVKH